MYVVKRPTRLFLRELSKFIKVAVEHAKVKGTMEIYCSCVQCKNNMLGHDVETAKTHSVDFGFVERYTI